MDDTLFKLNLLKSMITLIKSLPAKFDGLETWRSLHITALAAGLTRSSNLE